MTIRGKVIPLQALSRTSPVLQSSGNHGMTMTRREFLSASAALAVAPALGADAWGAPLPREADIVVIGAGAAGIAAARRIKAANRRVIVVEATGQIGGRCAPPRTGKHFRHPPRPVRGSEKTHGWPAAGASAPGTRSGLGRPRLRCRRAHAGAPGGVAMSRWRGGRAGSPRAPPSLRCR